MFEEIDLNAIQEENARELVKQLLNMIEQLSAEVRDVRAENQRLRDENNRLKGPSARQTQCQVECFQAAHPESFFRERTAYRAPPP
ncbi:MAG: hypothetical protein WAN58_07285 [Anaerolineales bacterium]